MVERGGDGDRCAHTSAGWYLYGLPANEYTIHDLGCGSKLMSMIHFQATVGVGGALAADLTSALISSGVWGYRSPDAPGGQIGALSPSQFKGIDVWRVSTGQGTGSFTLWLEGIQPAGFWERVNFEPDGTGVAFEVLEADCTRIEIGTYTQWSVASTDYLQTLGNPWGMVLR